MARLNETRIGALLTERFGAAFVRQAAAASHAEHGSALLVGIDGDVEVAGAAARAVIVPPHVPYALLSAGPAITYLFDPELAPRIAAYARDGGMRALDGALARRVAGIASAHRAQLAQPDVLAGVGDELARVLSIGTARPIDRRVARIADELREPDADRGELAARSELSAAHLRALFARDIGMPMRRYVLWRRLLHALARVGPVDLTTAAHAGGFADLAHFSRTCRRMLGYAPSELWSRLAG